MLLRRLKRRESLCEDPVLSPLGERVARDGAFTGRRGTGEGVPAGMVSPPTRGFQTGSSALPGATLLPVPPQVTSRWLEMLRHHPVRGGAVFDLQLIATLAANGVDRICTFNRADFEGFPGLEIVTP